MIQCQQSDCIGLGGGTKGYMKSLMTDEKEWVKLTSSFFLEIQNKLLGRYFRECNI